MRMAVWIGVGLALTSCVENREVDNLNLSLNDISKLEVYVGLDTNELGGWGTVYLSLPEYADEVDCPRIRGFSVTLDGIEPDSVVEGGYTTEISGGEMIGRVRTCLEISAELSWEPGSAPGAGPIEMVLSDGWNERRVDISEALSYAVLTQVEPAGDGIQPGELVTLNYSPGEDTITGVEAFILNGSSSPNDEFSPVVSGDTIQIQMPEIFDPEWEYLSVRTSATVSVSNADEGLTALVTRYSWQDFPLKGYTVE